MVPQTNHTTRGFGGGIGPRATRPSADAYDEYFKAYSVAMLPGNQRDNVSYGGKSKSCNSIEENIYVKES